MQLHHPHIILDACCIFNLWASERFLDILESISIPVMVAEDVRTSELVSLKSVEKEKRKNEDVSSNLIFQSAIDKKRIKIVDFETEEEEETFINYAGIPGMDDGESATGAIAFHRNWAIATDDKKAIKVFQKEAPLIQIVTTPDIIKHWAETTSLNTVELRKVLQSIRITGKYMPPRQHPLLQWWQQAMSAE